MDTRGKALGVFIIFCQLAISAMLACQRTAGICPLPSEQWAQVCIVPLTGELGTRAQLPMYDSIGWAISRLPKFCLLIKQRDKNPIVFNVFFSPPFFPLLPFFLLPCFPPSLPSAQS